MFILPSVGFARTSGFHDDDDNVIPPPSKSRIRSCLLLLVVIVVYDIFAVKDIQYTGK